MILLSLFGNSFKRNTTHKLCLSNGMFNFVVWLRSFFKANLNDLTSCFKITDINQAIEDTIEDSDRLQCIVMDISPDADLDALFRPLNSSRTSGFILEKEKARLKRTLGHTSWLRIYAIKLAPGIYIITGGAIKQTVCRKGSIH